MNSLTENLLELLEWMNRWESHLAKLAGLTVPQGKVLSLIGRLDGPAMREVSSRLDLTSGTVTLMIDRLERLGYVERRMSEQDRRSFRLFLTDRGKKVYELYRSRQDSMTARLLEGQNPILRAEFEAWLVENFPL